MANKIMYSTRRVLEFFVVCLAFVVLSFSQLTTQAGLFEKLKNYQAKSGDIELLPMTDDDYESLAKIIGEYTEDELQLMTIEDVKDFSNPEKCKEILKKNTTYPEGTNTSRPFCYTIKKGNDIIGKLDFLVFVTGLGKASDFVTTSVLLKKSEENNSGLLKDIFDMVGNMIGEVFKNEEVGGFFAGCSTGPCDKVLNGLFEKVSKLPDEVLSQEERNKVTKYSATISPEEFKVLDSVKRRFKDYKDIGFKIFFVCKNESGAKILIDGVNDLLNDASSRQLAFSTVKGFFGEPNSIAQAFGFVSRSKK